MEALKLSRKVYKEGLEKVEGAVVDGAAYLDQFVIEFPDGLNTASVREICRVIQDSDFDNKIHIAKLCVAGKNVRVTCPNGEVESFRLNSADDGLEGFPLFQKDPLALWALCDTIYGYLLKKYLRPSEARTEAEKQAQTSGR